MAVDRKQQMKEITERLEQGAPAPIRAWRASAPPRSVASTSEP